MAKWVRFYKLDRLPGRKTDIWAVAEINAGSDVPDLGQVRFYPRWRKFAFFPFENTLYEADCLRDIAEFCQKETRTWYDARKLRKKTL